MTRVKTNCCDRSNTSWTQFSCFIQSHSNTQHIRTGMNVTLELVGQKALSPTKGSLLKGLQAFLNLYTFNTSPNYFTHSVPLAASIQCCSVTRDTSREQHRFSGKATQYPWNVIREPQGDLILLRFYSKTVFSPGTNTLHLINKIKIQISQRNSYGKHFSWSPQWQMPVSYLLMRHSRGTSHPFPGISLNGSSEIQSMWTVLAWISLELQLPQFWDFFKSGYVRMRNGHTLALQTVQPLQPGPL